MSSSSGVTAVHVASLTTPTLIKTGKGAVYGMCVHNLAAGGGAHGYVQFFDKAAAADVTLGTTVPYWSCPADPDTEQYMEFPRGIHFTNGLVVGGTTTATGATTQAIHFVVFIGD